MLQAVFAGLATCQSNSEGEPQTAGSYRLLVFLFGLALLFSLVLDMCAITV